MENPIFRKKSLERISSPEQLNNYIKVSNPSVWMLLAAIIALLAGVCVWGVFGHMDTTLTAAAVAESGAVTCYVMEADYASLQTGMTVYIDGAEGTIKETARTPIAVTEAFDAYALHVGGLQEGEWVYPVLLSGSLPDGIYTAEIVVESISPVSFLLN